MGVGGGDDDDDGRGRQKLCKASVGAERRVRRAPAAPGASSGSASVSPAPAGDPPGKHARSRAEHGAPGKSAGERQVGGEGGRGEPRGGGDGRERWPAPAPAGSGLSPHRARSSPAQLFGLAGRLSTASPFPGGSTEDRQPGRFRGHGGPCPARAGAGGEQAPGLIRTGPLRGAPLCCGAKVNYKGCDYNDISPPRSACSGVKGSVLEGMRGAAIHTTELTVL